MDFSFRTILAALPVGDLPEHTRFVGKPFTMRQVEAAIHEVIAPVRPEAAD